MIRSPLSTLCVRERSNPKQSKEEGEDSHVVRLLGREDGAHERHALAVLLRSPIEVLGLAEMQIGEDGDFERAVGTEGQTGFVRVRASDGCEGSLRWRGEKQEEKRTPRVRARKEEEENAGLAYLVPLLLS